jgi:type IV pilus assembly protein PilA
MKTLISAEKKLRGFTLVEFIIIIAIINCITLILVPVYQEYAKRTAWTKSVAALDPLKQAIAKCLLNSQADTANCNDFSANKLAKYGVANAPSNDSFSTTVKKNAAITIVGSSELGMCVATFTPTTYLRTKTTEWGCNMQKQENNGDSLQKCKQYLNECNH